ncbi:DUF7289 family protein [Halorubrum sp. DTA98]|uniref:DUF7289 family protein n=1 Tax=Halorubrum sp. DTA98 TaxID=3402163 RepID=UPI003AAC1CA3
MTPGDRRRPRIVDRSSPESTADDRAVSETVGFVLVFALITTTIAMVFTLGLGGLEDAQIAERDNNVERAFDVLHDNLRDVSRDGVPSRATEIRLAGGELRLDERTEIRFNSSGWDAAYTERTRPIVYRGAGGTEIAYENGAVFRTNGPYSGVLNEPDLVVGDASAGTGNATIVYSLVRASGGTRSVSGDRTTLVVGSMAGRDVVDRDRSPGANVTMEIDSPRADAWERHYEELAETHDGIELDPDGDGDVTVVFDLGADGEFDEFVIHQTTIGIEFSD